jgi:uncharacterized membrane protein
VFRWQTPGAGYRLIGSLLYLLGTILVTIVCNVPLNDSLAAVDPTSANAAQAWAHYVTTWTAWNHLRTIAALAAAAAFYCGVLSGCVAGGGKIFVRKPRTRSS